ncbi:MAG TPA: lipopolysaccharide heptosyltransferase II [Bryobacteraceae bacterium]|nr:lipopolysaccharide heptosyltransferase II [Bryobacteraceae bacterium]
MDRIDRVLVRATNWVGDAVMSLPALQALRRRFPRAHVTVLARPWVADLYARESFADEVIPYTAGRGWNDIGGKLRLARMLRARRFDAAVLLQNAFEAAALAWLARIPRRIGYDRDTRGWLLTDRIPVPREGDIPRHEQFYYLELLRRAGLIDDLPRESTIRLHGAEPAAESGRARFEKLGIREPVIGVSAGAAYGTAKRWLPERFAEAASELAVRLDASVALFGSVDERVLCKEIATRIGPRARNLAGQTALREYIELAAACRVYLTNDSGGMHIASALGVPTVAVFGATNDETTGPTGPLARVVREPVDCAPCLLRECPIDHRCMTGVASERVIDEALALLSTLPVLK